MGHARTSRRLSCLLLALVFLANLAAPALLAAQEHERWDRALLDGLGRRVRTILDEVCERLSTIPDSRANVRTFTVDGRHRLFAEVEGSLVLDFPHVSPAWEEKIANGTGTHVATNGDLGLDVCVSKVERLTEGRFRVDFRLDLALMLEAAVHTLLENAAELLGAATLGAAAGKVAAFFDGLDVEGLAEAVKEATLKLWALCAGEAAAEAYRVLDETGHVSLKAVLFEGLTLRSFVYHFGVFILKAGVKAGAVLARLSFGAAVGASLCAQAGAAVGGALAVAAVALLGSVLVDQLTRDLPLWFGFRSLRLLHRRLAEYVPGSAGAADVLDRMDRAEDGLLEVVDAELSNEKYDVLDATVARLGALTREGALGPYEGLVAKLRVRLQAATMRGENWNAARKYWQLMAAVGRLPSAAAR